VFDQLVQVLPVIEVAKLGVSMLDCLPSRDLPTPLTQAKLGAIKDLVAGKVFKDDGNTLNTNLNTILMNSNHVHFCKLINKISYLFKIFELINFLHILLYFCFMYCRSKKFIVDNSM